MTVEIYPIDEFESSYMKQSVYDALQNGIRNNPSIAAQIGQTIEGKTVISDSEYHSRYSQILAKMMVP
jgi:hypothetical protein